MAEIFLKLLPFFPSDKNGEVTDEALAYSEWRYINYLRFLDVQGAAPCDYPPPWYVSHEAIWPWVGLTDQLQGRCAHLVLAPLVPDALSASHMEQQINARRHLLWS